MPDPLLHIGQAFFSDTKQGSDNIKSLSHGQLVYSRKLLHNIDQLSILLTIIISI